MAEMDAVLSEIVTRVRAAAAAGAPLCIRGGGSKDFYGQNLLGEVLDTRGLSGIVSYEPSELFVTVRAGTPLADLEAVLGAQGQMLAFEPPHFGAGATVGGMVASGLAGPSRAAVGGVRDFVLGLQLLNGRGELLTFGGQVMKNVAGYDVSRLVAGSLGTLGLIAEVSLKVLPCPVAEATLSFELELAAALRQLNTWAALPLPLNASSWETHHGQGRLQIRLRGAEAAVRAACAGMGGERQPESVSQPYWQAVREQTLPFFADRSSGQCLWRLSVPDSCGALTLPALCGDGAGLVEWGGALRWIKAPAEVEPALRETVAAVDGTATLFRRAATLAGQTPPVFHALAPPLLRIHQALKKQFDPAGIFNRGRLYADF